MPKQSKSLSEQLLPVAARVREYHTKIQPVSQLTVRLLPIEGKDRFAQTVTMVLRWMNR